MEANNNSLWRALYHEGYAERVHRLGFGGLSASECGRIGRIFSGKGGAEKGDKVNVEEVSFESLTISSLKKEHMRERARSMDNLVHNYSLTGSILPPTTLWESRRREMRRWFRLVTTDPYSKLWSVELAECYIGDIDLYGLGQTLGTRFFFYVASADLRVPGFIEHVLELWLLSMPFKEWGVDTITSPIFLHDVVMIETLTSLGFLEVGVEYLGREKVRILAYKILNS